ncbi:hypothetical protein BDY17DRAFT_302414 [Neohortaea acidophila]|uniref:Uncharacterized protein n=1 Tax=Neohortaea acidophila TaxID=245834 RepID=A0A6A6PM82_9PEZI|nr:uncharacterized protein BDY17DRAFT_302414 [Neohortaea acidophila]KAF2480801.1 hypothetical protein BDY17DRAFT_302414 [Neohortaea acidophila]
MSDDNNNQGHSPPPSHRRRTSFVGETLADLFGSGRGSMNRSTNEPNNSPPTQQMPGPISQAAAQAQRRRLSLTTLGLSASPNQSSAFASMRGRGDSLTSTNSGSPEESAIAEDDGQGRESSLSSSPSNTPFQRRTSFGARALRDIRTGSFSGQQAGSGGGGSPGQNGTSSSSNGSANKSSHTRTISSRDAKGRGSSEGFNWSDNLRSRAERTSIAGQGGLGGAAASPPRPQNVPPMEAPPVAPPKPKERPRPDHFQERILKGDFYMD